MPARTRQGPSTVTEVVEPEETSGGLRSLKFNQPLSWRVGRAIPIADLLQRLQTLAQELRKLEQEEIDKESLRKVSQELATANLLAHKDKGVRAWTACCIVDVLRLCAPDAPFTGNQLKVRFESGSLLLFLPCRARWRCSSDVLGFDLTIVIDH
jgi:sister-chromatid-cohesion protein PDS5